ncbi:MAG: bifunctional (p)ppGpp synthetase/guanosine-3',5'-bis(diphosphate) 3'-pyrophosphohydrolase [Polyangiaceae bacterium]
MLQLTELVDRVRTYHPAADTSLLSRAYEYSLRAHEGQKRKSGEPYFVHPASVAGIITELKLDTASVCAGLLHDVVEDTIATTDDISREFGPEIAELVDGVTKLSKINFASKEDRQAENFRKMVVAMSRDIRVLLIKLCDPLDNMRTLDHMKPEAQERIARETMDIYAPLANRLGMARLKAELEDLAFRYLEPEAYRDLAGKVAKTQKERDRYIQDVCRTLQSRLAEHGFKAEVYGRSKHLYSIYRKMVAQQVPFEQVHDVIAFRVLVESVADCYAVLGIVHSKWTPVPGRFKDYIALPKPNQYRSLHTTVIGPRRERIEIQTRTHEMNRVAEFGISAHWKYKERASGGMDPKDAASFAWLRELMEVQKELKDPAEFLETVKVELFQDEVYVFTPKGEVKVFPRNATPLDFAFAIHTDVGVHCSGARVNGVIVPLRYKLRSGDVVEILTNPAQNPTKDWLDIVQTSRARNKIRNVLRMDQRDRGLKLGRELLEKELHDNQISFSKFTKSQEDIDKVLEELHVQNLDELMMLVGYGKIAPAKVTAILMPPVPEGDRESIPPASVREGRLEGFVRKVTGKDEGGIKLSGIEDVLVRYAKCCNPLQGDEVLGFITRGRGLTVHRRDCPKAFDTDPERRVDITWDTTVKSSRQVQVRIYSDDRPGVLAALGQTFQTKGVNVSQAICKAGDDGRAINTFYFPCADVTQLKGIIGALKKVAGVFKVERI